MLYQLISGHHMARTVQGDGCFGPTRQYPQCPSELSKAYLPAGPAAMNLAVAERAVPLNRNISDGCRVLDWYHHQR
jgi:hypothetical protein